MERFNSYTNELKYSFQIDEISLTGTIPDEIVDTSSINLLFSGSKLYDCLGDDIKRNIIQNVRITDSIGTVIASAKNDSLALKTGEKFEDLKIDISQELSPGKYFIDINTPPDNSFSPVKENTEYFNPEKYYTTVVRKSIHEDNAELPFDDSSEWIKELRTNEIYVDENLMLYGIFSSPYDLNNAEFSVLESDDSKSFLISDFQYGDTYYYDITNFETLPDSIPEEAVPDLIRVTVSRQGNIIFGERESFLIAFCYKHNPDDQSSYIALHFESHPANAITQKEWNDIVSCAEEDDIPMSELLEKKP